MSPKAFHVEDMALENFQVKNFVEKSINPRPIRTVLGDFPYTSLHIVDAHTHTWIDPVDGAGLTSPILNQYDTICQELKRFRSSGGDSLLDSQPGGCGRNANRMIQLSEESGVNIIACTGFHLAKYYAPDHWLFSASHEDASEYFIKELTSAMDETDQKSRKAVAGFIKIALEDDWDAVPKNALLGAVTAAHETGALVEVHTEKGALAEKVVAFFDENGVILNQLVVCHIDKRADFALHSMLAHSGVLLEYDTFYRPKYKPEENLWPLILKMVENGLDDHIALATDMAEISMYRTKSNGPGMEAFASEIKGRLESIGCSDVSIRRMLGENIARRLAGLV